MQGVEARAADGAFAIQLGAYATRGEAEAAWQGLAERHPALAGRDPLIAEATVRSRDYFRVRARGFDAMTARSACRELRASGDDCFMLADPYAPAPPAASREQPAPEQSEPLPAENADPVLAGARSSFSFPARELYVRKHDSEARELLDGLTVTPGLYVPLSNGGIGGGTEGVAAPSSPTAQLNLRYQPAGYWFASVTVNKYLKPSDRNRWDPDFTYSFGYDDWHPYTFSLVYSNYANNRFDPEPGEPVSKITHGTISAGYKVPLPGRLARPMLVDQRLSIGCRVGVNVTPRYDRRDGSVGTWKSNASFGCRYPFTPQIFLDVTAFAWAHGQQPWDPDYTYSFGYYDYRNSRFALQYGNYSGNRFPWRHAAPGTGRFKNGGLLFSWSHQF